jgi:hypothetical protein
LLRVQPWEFSLQGRRIYSVTTKEMRNDEEAAQNERQNETMEPCC